MTPQEGTVPQAGGAIETVPITVFIRLKVRRGHEEQYCRIARELASEVRANEPDCLLFAPQLAVGTTNEFVVVARFRSYRAMQVHWETAHLKRALQLGNLIAAGAPVVEMFYDF